MNCLKCNSENIKRPEKQSAMELLECLDCGRQFYAHCYYPIPDEYKSDRKLYKGYYSVSSPNDSVKAFIKIKKLLKGCEWFQISNLEKQKIEGKHLWELGKFLDSEVDQIMVQSKKLDINIEFVEVPNA